MAVRSSSASASLRVVGSGGSLLACARATARGGASQQQQLGVRRGGREAARARGRAARRRPRRRRVVRRAVGDRAHATSSSATSIRAPELTTEEFLHVATRGPRWPRIIATQLTRFPRALRPREVRGLPARAAGVARHARRRARRSSRTRGCARTGDRRRRPRHEHSARHRLRASVVPLRALLAAIPALLVVVSRGAGRVVFSSLRALPAGGADVAHARSRGCPTRCSRSPSSRSRSRSPGRAPATRARAFAAKASRS